MDHEMICALAPTFFFEQKSLRRRPKRYKKLPEELPQDLRFAYVAPRVGAYLPDKEKDNLKVSEHDADFGDGLGKKSLLPQINAKVTLLQNQLNSTFSNDEDSQRIVFERAKVTAGAIIQQLSRILYTFDGLQIRIARSLENQLTSNFKELTADVNYVSREWQCPANKEEYLKKNLLSHGEETINSSDDAHMDARSISNTSRHTSEDDTRSVRSATEKDAKQPALRPMFRGKAVSRTAGGQLQDIAEDHRVEDRMRSQAMPRFDHPSTMVPIATVSKKDFREKLPSPVAIRSRHRVEKFKFTGIAMSGTDSRSSVPISHRSNAMSRTRHEDMQSIIAESMSDATLVDRSGYWTIIQFQLSSKQCEEKGWIVPPELKADRERETMLEWATQRLQMAIKQRKAQEYENKKHGLDKQVVVRYYGDSRRDAIARQAQNVLGKSLRHGKPDIPKIPDQLVPDKPIFMTTVSDGSTTIYYPSGLPAVVTSSCPMHRSGYYTLAFDDTPDKHMLASFTPSGRGCCYHRNGVVKFLSSEKEWTMSGDDGAITRRSKWPSNGLKMAVALSIQLNAFLVLKYTSHSCMHLYYHAEKEMTKVSVGASCTEDIKDDPVELISGLPFTSQTAKEYLRQHKPRTHASSKVKLAKPKGKNKLPTDMQKLLDMPEATENDAEADRNLYRLQRKIKNLIEDWLEHYRIAVGIRSPHIHNFQSGPLHRQRPIQSANSSPPGVRVIIESLSTAVPHIVPSTRIPSAPAGRSSGRPSVSVPEESKRPASTGHAVKFDDYHIEEIEPDNVSVVHITPLPSTAPSQASSHLSLRSRSAPLALTLAPDAVWSLRFGSCPVALRDMLLGEERPTCQCSQHKIPYITDVEYDQFIQKHVPVRQMVVVSVLSSIYPDATPALEMLEQLYNERNRNRTQPCVLARSDPYRILLYDVASTANLTNHTNPLLLRRHNVVPGMFLMYDHGDLVFCDHIFNGYGSTRKDFLKQLMATRRMAAMGRSLPRDFRFSGLDPMAAQFGNAKLTPTGIRLQQDVFGLRSRPLSTMSPDHRLVHLETNEVF